MKRSIDEPLVDLTVEYVCTVFNLYMAIVYTHCFITSLKKKFSLLRNVFI